MNTRDKVQIDPRSKKILEQLLEENPEIEKILNTVNSLDEFKSRLKNWAKNRLSDQSIIEIIESNESFTRNEFEELEWTDYSAIRIIDYINHDGLVLEDLNLNGQEIESSPIKKLYLAYKNGRGGAKPEFFTDFIYLFRQIKDEYKPTQVTESELKCWMDRYPPAYSEELSAIREKNKKRIIKILINKIDNGEITNRLFTFDANMSYADKFDKMLEWWEDYRFHIAFAVRSPDLLNELLDYSLSPEVMQRLYTAQEKGIPFFINPNYLTLLMVNNFGYSPGIDQTIRDYMIYSEELIEEFGDIVAWEKEDQVEPGKPNAAGWILPTKESMHRRYPNVAILIPDTMGRACGGLCSTCQRMYDFQRGHLNFDYASKKPDLSWGDKLEKLMDYFKKDAQLRDILITGGDALMSSNESLKQILDAVYQMAKDKKKLNAKRPEEEKYAEMVRVRLGTRLPVYLPQRIDNEMVDIIRNFKIKAQKIGIRQFVIQTHIESPLEITDRTKKAIEKFLSAGWIVTNQLVFTASASRRGHTAKLRKILNDIGVLTYYTFTCKGFMENYRHFATNARAVQEQLEEKCFGEIPGDMQERLNQFPKQAPQLKEKIDEFREDADIEFLSTDRNVLNLPAVGKSLTFRTIGLTYDGRRILEFDHDHTRSHSPIIEKLGKVRIIESKSITNYLKQLHNIGEDIDDYQGIYGYSIGATEKRMPIYQYPDYDFEVTDEITNLEL